MVKVSSYLCFFWRWDKQEAAKEAKQPLYYDETLLSKFLPHRHKHITYHIFFYKRL